MEEGWTLYEFLSKMVGRDKHALGMGTRRFSSAFQKGGTEGVGRRLETGRIQGNGVSRGVDEWGQVGGPVCGAKEAVGSATGVVRVGRFVTVTEEPDMFGIH